MFSYLFPKDHNGISFTHSVTPTSCKTLYYLHPLLIFTLGRVLSWSTVVLRDGTEKNGCYIACVQSDMFKTLP